MKEFETWLAEAEAFRQRNRRPLVSLCYAQSLDGSLAARRGQPTALSGSESNRLTHELRAVHDAILVGVGTVLSDNPRLTVRLAQGKDPQPVVLDSRLYTPPEANIVCQHPRPPWIATTQSADPQRRAALVAAGALILPMPADAAGHVQLPVLLECLADKGINKLMVEGGAKVIASFLAQRLADLAILTIVPLFLGGLQLEQDGTLPILSRLRDIGYQRLGDDLIVWGKIYYC
jgi:riboflavin-specific deaminase-like protein